MYDPLGSISPVVLQGKILIQEGTHPKLSWGWTRFTRSFDKKGDVVSVNAMTWESQIWPLCCATRFHWWCLWVVSFWWCVACRIQSLQLSAYYQLRINKVIKNYGSKARVVSCRSRGQIRSHDSERTQSAVVDVAVLVWQSNCDWIHPEWNKWFDAYVANSASQIQTNHASGILSMATTMSCCMCVEDIPEIWRHGP